MSHKYKVALEREIEKLNEVIDRKIISGLNYAEDARRHKKLLATIRRSHRKQVSWFKPMQSLRYLSMFLF